MIGGKGYTIVGVMPRAFTSGLERTALRTAISIDIWIPAQLSPQLLAIREARFLRGVGRMRPGLGHEFLVLVPSPERNAQANLACAALHGVSHDAVW